MTNSGKVNSTKSSTKGESVIKVDMILNAFQDYRRQSRLYRLCEFLGLR